MSGMVFEVMQETANAAVIKVIGVGGGGCNAIDNMISSHVHGVEFICANTELLISDALAVVFCAGVTLIVPRTLGSALAPNRGLKVTGLNTMLSLNIL